MITKVDAQAIAKKLKAEMEPGRRHDLAKIRYQQKLIASFGIQRGSKKDQGHDYIPQQIYLSNTQTKSMAQCNISYDQWIKVMIEKRIIQGSD